MDNRKLIFQQLFEAESSTFTYLLADRETREAVLIDSVLEKVDRDLKLIAELELNLKYVLDTHVHADHVTGAGLIRSRTGAKAAVARAANIACADVLLCEGDEIKFGEFALKVIETPGHTDSSLSFYIEGMVFTGDALLIRGCGRTDFQGGSAEKLFDSVTQKLWKLPAETIVYPAHDYKGFTASSIEVEQKNNPRLGGSKSKAEFIEIMSKLDLPYPKMIDRALPANQLCGLERTESEKQAGSIQMLSLENLSAAGSANSLLIDVRRPDEFVGELGHIAGAHLITLGPDLEKFLDTYDRSEPIVFVCRSGQRSMQAAQLAVQKGFESVGNLVGGMLRWNELKLATQRKTEQ